ncbi:MAG: dipeptidase [Bacteroidales bacterium]|nr:dipeptidase [Bacteroidales bacterium]
MNHYQLHTESIVLDSHCDTPLRMMEGHDVVQRSNTGHFDLERMKDGKVDAVFFAVYTSNALSPEQASSRALNMVAKIHDLVAQNAHMVGLGLHPKDVYTLRAEDKLTIFMGMENGSPIQKDLSLLRLFYKLGVRYMTLTHAGNNEICDSCATKEPRWNGLSPFGIEVVNEMNRLGMMIDVSHISDAAFYDVLKYSSSPVVATHSCCRAICDAPRNMSNQMIKDLAAKDGVIQINFYPAFLDKKYAEAFKPLCNKYEDLQELWKQDPVKYGSLYKEAEEEMMALKTPSYKVVVDHIDHVVSLVGPAHVGLGSDFDGIETTPQGLDSIADMSVITKELLHRGYSEDSVRNILGLNFLRVFSACVNTSCQH